MRTRFATVLGLLFVAMVILGNSAAADDPPDPSTSTESVKGVIRGPDQKPIAGVHIAVTTSGEGTAVGETTTAADGTWTVPLPGPGKYDVTIDTATLPDTVQPRRVGGEVLSNVDVRGSTNKSVLFPLIPKSQTQQPAAPPTSNSDDDSATVAKTPITLTRVTQLTVEGIKLGAIIAITAVGLSLVFGTTRLINFAHGELVTLGAVVAFWLSTRPLHLPFILATVLAVIVGGLAGVGLEAGLWRPMRKRGTGLIQMFIISIGVSLLVRHLILIYFGPRRPQYSAYAVQETWKFGLFTITPRDATIVLISFAVLIGVATMLRRTRIGKAMRAVSDNKDLAESSGIDVNRVIMVVWFIGGGLAALGGVFYGLLAKAVYWDMGFNLLLLMFAGVILGGLGSAYGAMIGSFLVGLVAQLSTLWFPVDLQNAWALLVLILVLLVRPQGILGQAERAG